MKLLIVDDDPGMATLLAKAMRRLGQTAVTAHSPREALDRLREGADLIILDAALVAMSSLELTAVLRGIAPGAAVAFLASADEAPRVAPFGAVLPRVWTVTQLRELLAHIERGRARGSQPQLQFAAAGPLLTTPSRPVPALRPPPLDDAHPSAEASVAAPAPSAGGVGADDRVPIRKVRVQCRSWEQVARLCEQHAAGRNVITLRGAYKLREGEALIVALALPDELVLALRADCVQVRRDRDGGRLYGINVHGLTADVRARLERMVAQARTAPMPQPPPRPPRHLTS